MDRYDRVGLWWADYPAESRQATARAIREVAPPDTGWMPPTELPNLTGVRAIGLDTESRDQHLTDGKGGGAPTGQAHCVGLSIATEESSWYFPLRHEYAHQRQLNMDPEKVFRWLKDVLAQPKIIIGANLLYDLEILRAEGIEVKGHQLFDIQFAEPLIDENRRSYSLDTLSRAYTLGGKKGNQLYEWCAESFGGKADEKQRANIYRAPPTLVGPYAEADALLPIKILRQQWEKMRVEELTDLFKMECELIPLLLDMRFRGVRIDEVRARQAATWLREQAKVAQDKIPGVGAWENQAIAVAFDKAGLEYPRTEAGNPSFTKLFLESVHHPLARAVLDVRLYEKAANPFVESYLLENMHNGRVHCRFHPLRSDEYGTVSGRFSSSDPNLQNIPVRHEVIGPLLRSLFIPEEGCKWRRQDYNQIEYRLLAHDAIGRGADEIRARYINDPTTDFHVITIDMVNEKTSIVLARRPAKNLNFGLVYGMGRDKLVASLGVGVDVGERLYEAYFEAMPAVKTTYKSADRLARRRGYIKTLLKRRRRFADGESTHKALNARLQGGAADIMKKAMRDMHKAGVCDVLGAPHLTVHDELDWSDPCTRESAEAFAEAERIMVECVKLKVPLLVAVEKGDNWGDCK